MSLPGQVTVQVAGADAMLLQLVAWLLVLCLPLLCH